MAGQATLLRRAARPMLCRCKPFKAAFSLRSRSFTVMGIETSADDTCVAVLELDEPKGAVRILFNERATVENKADRGIHPATAVTHHGAWLPQLVHKAMLHLGLNKGNAAYLTLDQEETAWSAMRGLPYNHYLPLPGNRYDIRKPDLIAVTRGPGMGTCLNTGISTAKALSVAWTVPIVGVHHMQAHALTPFMEAALKPTRYWPLSQQNSTSPKEKPPRYPLLTVLVSGKHTQLVHTTSPTNHRILATAANIALGDFLDKVARDLVPTKLIQASGSTIVYAKVMEEFIAPLKPLENYRAPRSRENEITTYKSAYGWSIGPPLADVKHMSYQLSGLNGLVLRILSDKPDMPDDERRSLALHSMRIGFEHVMSRVILALNEDHELRANPPKTLVLSGGVASSQFLRHVAQETLIARGFPDIKVIAPDMRFCTDNAAMVAYTGAEMYRSGRLSDLGFSAMPRWSIENILMDVPNWTVRPGISAPAGTDAATDRAIREKRGVTEQESVGSKKKPSSGAVSLAQQEQWPENYHIPLSSVHSHPAKIAGLDTAASFADVDEHLDESPGKQDEANISKITTLDSEQDGDDTEIEPGGKQFESTAKSNAKARRAKNRRTKLLTRKAKLKDTRKLQANKKSTAAAAAGKRLKEQSSAIVVDTTIRRIVPEDPSAGVRAKIARQLETPPKEHEQVIREHLSQWPYNRSQPRLARAIRKTRGLQRKASVRGQPIGGLTAAIPTILKKRTPASVNKDNTIKLIGELDGPDVETKNNENKEKAQQQKQENEKKNKRKGKKQMKLEQKMNQRLQRGAKTKTKVKKTKAKKKAKQAKTEKKESRPATLMGRLSSFFSSN